MITFNPNVGAYLPLLVFGGGAMLFMGISLGISALLRPKKPTDAKLTVYESGEDTVGSAQAGFNIRYFRVALLFILFEIDVVLLFPYLIKAGEPNYLKSHVEVVVQLLIFIGMLALGLWYAWAKNYLEWNIPAPEPLVSLNNLPASVYEKRTAELEAINKSTGTSLP